MTILYVTQCPSFKFSRTNSFETRNEYYLFHYTRIFKFATTTKNNMTDTQTFEVETTLAPLNIERRNDVRQRGPTAGPRPSSDLRPLATRPA
jgi:hypothetical protein